MKTILAKFTTLETAQQAAQSLREVGLDPHYVKVIAPHPEQEKAMAYRGNIHGGKGFSPEAADLLQGEDLIQALRSDFGAEQSQDLLNAVLQENRALTIAQASDYLQKGAVAALMKHTPLEVTSQNVNWHKGNRPSEPGAYGENTPTPTTKDFYDKSELEGTFRESEKMIDYEARRSRFYEHYNRAYAPLGVPFDRYEPAYRFGWREAQQQGWHDQEWDVIDADVEAAWRKQEAAVASWEDVKDAVRCGWEEVHRSER